MKIDRKKERVFKKSGFRIRAKNFFLTYSQLPKNINIINDVKNQLIDILKKPDMKYLISKELHEDGNPHVHVYLNFDLPVGVYSPTKLDLIIKNDNGKEEKFHGKYESVKNKHDVIEYLLKDQKNENTEMITNIELPIYNNKYYCDIFDHLHAVLVGEGLESAIELLYENYPNEAMKRGSQIMNNLRLAEGYESAKRIKKNTRVRTLNDFSKIPKEITEWMSHEKKKTLILHGPSGTGKTELAKAILNDLGKKYLFIRDINALKGFSLMTHQAVIFDDLSVEDMSRESLIHICDTENPSTIRILYGTKDIPAETNKIFTTNVLSAITRSDPAILRRVTICNIKEPLHAALGFEETPRLTNTDNVIDPPYFNLPTSSPLGDNSSPLGDNSSTK